MENETGIWECDGKRRDSETKEVVWVCRFQGTAEEVDRHIMHGATLEGSPGHLKPVEEILCWGRFKVQVKE